MSRRTHAPRSAVLDVEPLEERLVPDATSFVTALYRDVLNRTPDTQGLNFWVQRLQNGTNNNLQVATNFWESAEHRGQEVDQYYQTYLNRGADANGRAFWVNRLLAGLNNEIGVQLGLLASVEYVGAHNTPVAYVSGVYLEVLGRIPTMQEESFWENVLVVQGAAVVSGNILTSTEAFIRDIDSYFTNFLHRSADASGQAFWLAKLQSNQGSLTTVAEGFLGSSEYANIN
jgi:hypothetical protein